MTVIVTSAPAELAVTLAEAKKHLYINSDTDADRDATLTEKLWLAISEFERMTGRALVTQTQVQVFDQFPTEDFFLLERAYPLQSVTHIKYYNEDDVLTTLESSVYGVASRGIPPSIYVKTDQVWPEDIHPTRPDCVEVTLIAGHGLSSTVPQDIKAVISMIAGDLYKYREDHIDAPGIVVAKVFDVYRRFFKFYKTHYYEHRSQSRRSRTQSNT